MSTQPQAKFVLMAGLALLVTIVSYDVFTAPDQREGVEQLPAGADKAVEFKDRTPDERLGDEARDAGIRARDSDNR